MQAETVLDLFDEENLRPWILFHPLTTLELRPTK